MNADELRRLMHSPALGPEPADDTADLVRARAGGVRRRRRTVVAAGVIAVVVALVVGPGLPDRFVPAERRGPAANAAALPVTDPAQVALQVSYAAGAYDSIRTETAVAACAGPTTALVRLQLPQQSHLILASGTAVDLATLRACLAAIPGATVVDAP